MVYIILAKGFEESEALVPTDLLRRAGIETALVSLEGDMVEGSHKIQVKADLTLSQVDLTRAEMIVLPGGLGGVRCLEREHAVAALVQEAADRDIWVAAICAAPTLLARWGHLKNRKAVCYPGMEGELTQAQPQMDRGVVVDGRFITGRAAGSSFDFGLALIESQAGADKAREVRGGVCYQ